MIKSVRKDLEFPTSSRAAHEGQAFTVKHSKDWSISASHVLGLGDFVTHTSKFNFILYNQHWL